MKKEKKIVMLSHLQTNKENTHQTKGHFSIILLLKEEELWGKKNEPEKSQITES